MRCVEGLIVPFWKLYCGFQKLKEEMKCNNVQNASSTVEHSMIYFLYSFSNLLKWVLRHSVAILKTFSKNLILLFSKLRNNNLN